MKRSTSVPSRRPRPHRAARKQEAGADGVDQPLSSDDQALAALERQLSTTRLTNKQKAYLLTAFNFLVARRPFTQKAVAEAAGVGEATVCHWQQDAAFRRAQGLFWRALCQPMLALEHAASIGRSLSGSFKDYELHCRMAGLIDEPIDMPIGGGAPGTAAGATVADGITIFCPICSLLGFTFGLAS